MMCLIHFDYSLNFFLFCSIHKGFCFHQGVLSPISDLTERLLLEERDPSATPQESLYEAPPFDEVGFQNSVLTILRCFNLWRYCLGRTVFPFCYMFAPGSLGQFYTAQCVCVFIYLFMFTFGKQVDIQALAHAVKITRQGAVDSLRFARGDLFQAFQVIKYLLIYYI